jgi:hypothetical protein
MQLASGNQLGNERLVGWRLERRPGTQQEGEAEEQRRCHLVGERQPGEPDAGNDLKDLEDDQEPAPVEDIGQRATRKRKQEIG